MIGQDFLNEADMDDMIWLLDSCLPLSRPMARRAENSADASAITEKQLRALGKRHLLMMIRDLEKELRREREEKQHLLMAYQAGRSRS